MAERVYLHIGAPKSGTTFLQTMLWSNKELLRRSGVLLPGEKRTLHNSVAAWARSESPSRAKNGDWARARREIADWPGDALISCEWFTMVPDHLIGRLIDGLQPSEVHVVFTARSYARTVPAAWQERLKLGDAIDLDDMIGSLEAGDDERWSWATLDPARVLSRWGEHVPDERIHLVTVPPSGTPSSVLWTRMAQACRLPEEGLSLDGTFANESLTAEAARLMQLVGPQMLDEVGAVGYDKYRWIRNYFCHTLLAKQPGHKIKLLPHELEAVAAHADRAIAALEACDYDVVGDLADLRDAPDQSSALRPSDVGDEVLLALAARVLPTLLGRLRAEHDRAGERREATTSAGSSRQRGHERSAPRTSTAPELRQRLRSEIGARVPVGVRRWATRAVRRSRA